MNVPNIATRNLPAILFVLPSFLLSVFRPVGRASIVPKQRLGSFHPATIAWPTFTRQ